MSDAKNVLGGELETCGTAPATGFYRNGCCDTGADDIGVHAVCAHDPGIPGVQQVARQ